MKIELKHDRDLWTAYSGAESFPDGTAPFFAELPSVKSEARYANAVLILDWSGERTVLSLNLNDEEGYSQVASKDMLGLDPYQAKAWAERHIEADDNLLALELLGFKLEDL